MRPSASDEEREVRELLAGAERPVVVPPFSGVRRRAARTPLIPVALGAAVMIVGAVALGIALRDFREGTRPATGGAATSSPIASASPTAMASASATPSVPQRLVTHESPVFGYRISLPETYSRLEPSYLVYSTEPMLGTDSYTLQTERERRDECLTDLGDIPSRAFSGLLWIHTYRNPANLSATRWVNTPYVPHAEPMSTQRRVEPLALAGRDAVRLVADNPTPETQAVVIRADDRIYVLTSAAWPSPHRFEEIAATFATIPRQPFPTPTPRAPLSVRRPAASELAQSLARAFAARDADAVARVMPECHLSVSPVIDGGGLANSGGGGLQRSVPRFTQALRDRFAAGDLTVSVDPSLQVEGTVDGFYYLRSEWKETDRTTRIDLLIDDRDGRWIWHAARHHYTREQVGSPPQIPYRSPWR